MSNKKPICTKKTTRTPGHVGSTLIYVPITKDVELDIRFQEDGIHPKTFFFKIIEAYIDRDPCLMEFVEKYQEVLAMHLTRNRLLKKQYLAYRESEKNFGLTNNDIESVFTLLEKEKSED